MVTSVTLSDRARQVLGQWYDQQTLDARVLQGSLFGRLFGLFGQHAVTINGTVHLTPKAPDPDSERGIALVGHEFYHVVDQRTRGWWPYLARYIVGWRPSHISNGRTHPLEAPAYARGREVLQALQGQD